MHAHVGDLPAWLRPGDLLVLNDTRVIPARVRARRPSGGRLEVLLCAPSGDDRWDVLVKGSPRAGERVLFATGAGEWLESHGEGRWSLRLDVGPSVLEWLDAVGEVPLPPYIHRSAGPTSADRERYQTVFAQAPGAVAAPTAGLHFTPELFAALAARGIERTFVTLHVGPGTFLPIRERRPRRVSHGTRTVRHRRRGGGRDRPGARRGASRGRGRDDGRAGARIGGRGGTAPRARRRRGASSSRPDTRFRVVDALLTNFHLPRTPLLAHGGGAHRLGAHPPGVRDGGAGPVPLLQLRRRDADLVSAPSAQDRVPSFVVERTHASGARLGRLTTAHGVVETPAFMPVATHGSVKGVTPAQLVELGATIVLSNAYHLAQRPGTDVVQALGGLHALMGWPGPILTDSGGFQVMSLAGLVRVDDDGVSYRSHVDGRAGRLAPEDAVAVQEALGVDVAMSLDECVAAGATPAQVTRAVRRTTAWAARGLAVRRRPDMALFGIVQGAFDPEQRRVSAAELVALEFDGYAAGGLSVGEPPAETARIARTHGRAPPARPAALPDGHRNARRFASLRGHGV